jgi:hypothetical protein
MCALHGVRFFRNDFALVENAIDFNACCCLKPCVCDRNVCLSGVRSLILLLRKLHHNPEGPIGMTTVGLGARDASECVLMVCPKYTVQAGSSPDSEGDCNCVEGSVCNGPKCRVHEDPGEDDRLDVHFYEHRACPSCICLAPDIPPTIDRVMRPYESSVHYTGELLEVLYEASEAIGMVHIGLFTSRLDDSGWVDLVVWFCQYCESTGVYEWTVPTYVNDGDRYIIVVMHAPLSGETKAPTHRNSFTFEIATPTTTQCHAGHVNPNGGRPPGCTPCLVGTYTADDAQSCIACTVRVYRQEFTLEDAIGSHACSLEALPCV